MNTAEYFTESIKEFSYKGKAFAPLTNLTFFMGAGFSKSWSDKYPLGQGLFDFKLNPIAVNELLPQFFKNNNYDLSNIDFDVFTECYYKLNMLKKYPELLPRYLDSQAVDMLDSEFRVLVSEKLKSIVKINHIKNGTLRFSKYSKSQQAIVNFFCSLFDQIDGGNGVPDGVRTHFLTTNYDFIIEGILDEYYSTFGDSLFNHIYRGFTPKTINGTSFEVKIHDHYHVMNLLKINGGLEINTQDSNFNLDYRKDEEFTPEIILPSKEQNYTNKYFNSIFTKMTRLLQESKMLCIVGYSFPKEDALLRFILQHFAENERDLIDKRVFYIDFGEDKNLLKEKLNSILPYNFEQNNIKVYNKGFNDFVKEVNSIGLPK